MFIILEQIFDIRLFKWDKKKDALSVYNQNLKNQSSSPNK